MITFYFVGILFVAAILAFIGFCLYGLFTQKNTVKKARTVEASVRSCEQKILTEKDGNKFTYYLVTVDFYGLNGEMIEKTIKSQKSYQEGAIIPSRYLDETGQLWLEMNNASINRNSSKLLTLIGFLVLFFVVVLIVISVKFSGDAQAEDLSTTVFGYIISIVFIGIGIFGIRKKLELKNTGNMQVVEGTQVDYHVVHGRTAIGEANEASVYYPIYEYTLMGESRRYQSNIGGSNKKYRTIGRKVHMLIDPETGKIMCREDAQTGSSMYILFGVLGILVLCIMLAVNFGLL